MVKNNSFKKIVGGIGDFIQGADSAIAEKEIKVYSHAKNASDFFSGLGVKAHLQYFKEIEEIYPMEEKDDLSRHLFYNFTPPEKSVKCILESACKKTRYSHTKNYRARCSEVID